MDSEALQQKRREEFLRFRDVSCATILSRSYTPEPEAPEASAAGAAGRKSILGSPNKTKSPPASSLRAPSIIAPPQLFASTSGTRLPPIEGYSNMVCQGFMDSEQFFAECFAELDRHNADRKKKYLKKYAALNLKEVLPFRASGAAILHHVERIIVREDRESTWREEHAAAVRQMQEIEAYCSEHFTNPHSKALLAETRTILVSEETVPTAAMFSSRLLRVVPPTSLLLDEVVTTASHLSSLFLVSKPQAVAAIRDLAARFVEDHTVELEAQLSVAQASASIGLQSGGMAADSEPGHQTTVRWAIDSHSSSANTAEDMFAHSLGGAFYDECLQVVKNPL
jgi:hypothetical protein